MWKRILSYCANSNDFWEETVIEEITNIGRENDDVRDLRSSHPEELTDDDLLLDQQN
jgi:hypothetical protein